MNLAIRRRRHGAFHSLSIENNFCSISNTMSSSTTISSTSSGSGSGSDSDPLSPHDYTIDGVGVSFPCAAYPSQVAMMESIVGVLKRGENALLESPTGSGKTLALLCGALAWQREETEVVRKHSLMVKRVLAAERALAPGARRRVAECDANREMDGGGGGGDDDDAMMIDDEVVTMTEDEARAVIRSVVVDEEYAAAAAVAAAAATDVKTGGSGGSGATVYYSPRVTRTVPQIFFGTRTHKQIDQVIRELNKTVYRGVKMTILGSRDRACIHPKVSLAQNRNEACADLNDRKKREEAQKKKKKKGSEPDEWSSAATCCGGQYGQQKQKKEDKDGCLFRSKARALLAKHRDVNHFRGRTDAWDLEDMVTLGKKLGACPYYASRDLAATADIVFCPYNYLMDPLIRRNMKISLEGQILIVDEAHNIEDSARSAASWQVTQDEVRDVMRDLERLEALGYETESHHELALMCSRLSHWIESCCSTKLDDCRVWTGSEIADLFEKDGFGRSSYDELRAHLDLVDETGRLSSKHLSVLEGFFVVLGNIYGDGGEMRHADDYRVALTPTAPAPRSIFSSAAAAAAGQKKKKMDPAVGSLAAAGATAAAGGTSSPLSSSSSSAAVVAVATSASHIFGVKKTLNFWCLNPAVAFLQLKKSLRSIVLTSGTLSPMTSFSSELDIDFSVQLEADHVIDRKQVWIGTLGRGPSHHSLNATYANAQSDAFKDEIGHLVLGVCQTMTGGGGGGILLFLPSYAMLDNLSARWRATGLWDQLASCKEILAEPRSADQFQTTIRHYYDIVDASTAAASAVAAVASASSAAAAVDAEQPAPRRKSCGGALLMAIFRGKVSEGLDFADDYARAVICVGIPFPNVQDAQVELKREYNNERRSLQPNGRKTILTGSRWYEIQAFRALNQALGRCIRHRNDWGAIIMADDRYQQPPKYPKQPHLIENLSKWVRSGVVHHSDFTTMLGSLGEFRSQMMMLDDLSSSKTAATAAAAVTAATTAAAAPPPTPPPTPPPPPPKKAKKAKKTKKATGKKAGKKAKKAKKEEGASQQGSRHEMSGSSDSGGSDGESSSSEDDSDGKGDCC